MNYRDQLLELHKYAASRLNSAHDSEKFRFRVDLDPDRGHLSVHMMLGPSGSELDSGNVAVRVRAGLQGAALEVALTCTFCSTYESLRWKLTAFSTLESIARAWHSRIHGKVFEV